MIVRASLSLVPSIWLMVVVAAFTAPTFAERWSRQVSNSEWIPLANPRSQQQQQQGHNQNYAPPPLPQIHQPLIPGSLPPELRQEYQQQLVQLQKTQESIQRLLLLQQQLKQQQQLLQGQAYLPNGITESEENKQSLHQSAIANVQTLPELAPQVFVPHNFREPQSEIAQEQYEDYVERRPEDYRGGDSERPRESPRDKDKYETPSGAEEAGGGDDGEEEIQVVYVPAETLAQRGGHSKSQQRPRDRKQFGNQDATRLERPYAGQRGQESEEARHRENAATTTTVSPEEDAYARELLQQLQREHEGTDRILKEARKKELDRLREERKEIQRAAKLQQEALEREQEIQRQREAEKKRKELAQLEETAKQRELERLRASSRERQRLEEMERANKARANEEKRKQEEATRRAQVERLAAQKEEEERRAERNRQKESSSVGKTPQAQPLIRNQYSQNHNSGKYNRHGRVRNKPRQRPQSNRHVEQQFEGSTEETTTESTEPLSPNQPPLAVYMTNVGGGGDSRGIRISDVLKTLKDAKTIDVLDNVGQDAPQVFVGPSNLQVSSSYAKFDLPYLSSIDNNRVERRVDKLPFFVAPLSFNPPPGYSKIPFPAPHIGSVVVNTLDVHPLSQPDGSLDHVGKLDPLIEPNSFIDGNNEGGVSYSTTYDSPTTPPTYANYRQEEPSSSSTPQYQSTPSYSTVETSGPGRGYRFRQQFAEELHPSSPESQTSPAYHKKSQHLPAFQDETQSHNSPQYHHQESIGGPTTPIYKRPNVETSFSYRQEPRTISSSSTPVYQENYSRGAQDSGNVPQHRQVVDRYELPVQNERAEAIGNYDDSLRGPTQYNLPAELPPIIPQLPGLVNSLLDEGEQEAAYVSKKPLSTTTTTTTTTTTEAPTTTVRSRGRHRGRLVATRPSTTSTTTTPSSRSRDTTRRPFGRTRSRFTTTTTEDYRNTYDEPTTSKITETTQRSYTPPDNYRRPTTSTRTQKLKSREPDESHNAHEAVSNEKVPSLDSNEPVYSQYNFAPSTLDNYPVQQDDGTNDEQVDYSSKPRHYPPGAASYAPGNERNQEEQYQEDTQYTQTSLEDSPVNGFNYQVKSTPAVLYQKKQSSFEASPPGFATETPIMADKYTNGYDIGRDGEHNEDLRHGPIYQSFAADNQEGQFGSTGLLPQQVPLELTTERTTTTSTTTTAPVILRQRVRARLGAGGGARGRPDSAIQTRPRGSQDEYVRFSAVNNKQTPTTERPTTRNRETTRSRTKSRPQYNGVQVQTEGNDYVRIQAPIRTYQKTIVTPPSRTSTTPRTTTAEYESNDEIEYGFIRPPNFTPVDNGYHNSYRPVENQAQLQSVVPIDETAQDSSPSHAQISRNRPKYQTPNRRPTGKAISPSTSSLNSEVSAYSDAKPTTTRVDEPKNNRIRVRGRKPARRRTTSTTTTTTTEYVLEENNNLPLEENYPRPAVVETVGEADRQTYYEDDRFETLPLASGGGARSPVEQLQQHRENSFGSQDFVLNFGAETASSEADQTQLGSHPPPRKYGQASGPRAHTPRRGSQDRDIYGAESQWSTKLTSTSFQPSPTANRLPQDEAKSGSAENDKYKYANDEASADEPEIITAAPEDSFVTVLVSSDDRHAKSASSSAETSMETSMASMDGTNFGMKTNSHLLDSTTPTTVTSQETALPANSPTEIAKETIARESNPETRPTRRMGGRRRRVRVRVRPAATDDFVTAESQHFNSAINSLVQDRLKYNRFEEASSKETTTINYRPDPPTETTENTIFDDFLDEMFKNDNKSSANSETTTFNNNSEPVTTTAKVTQVPEESVNRETTTIKFGPNSETTVDNNNDLNEIRATNAPITSTVIPGKSWDSTKLYIDSVAMQSGEFVPSAKYSSSKETAARDFDENSTGPSDNQVFENDYRDKEAAKSGQETTTEDENYPKNHRSEWSQVRYPTDRGLFHYYADRSIHYNSTKTQLPGVVTKSDGEASVKTLSDYVKAIFDTMKDADEQKSDQETSTDLISPDVPLSTDSTTTSRDLENDSPTTLLPELDDHFQASTVNSSVEKAVLQNDNEQVRTEITTTGIERDATERDVQETSESDVQGSTEISTEANVTSSSSSSLASEASSGEPSYSEPTETTSTAPTTTTTTTTEVAPLVSNNSTKLGAILRTSTTTKVSHMTEICYRGRCVMTKPKKDFRKR